MADGGLVVRDPDDLPALYRSANDASLAAQALFFGALRVRLIGLLCAAVAGAFAWHFERIPIGGLIALVSFLASIGAELYGAIGRPDRVWYEGRAAAESAKTLAWRYMVRGESFADLPSDSADKRFVAELDEILHDLRDIELTTADEARQITQAMRDARAAAFSDRRQLYLVGRVQEQQGWYARKADWNGKRSRRWLYAGITAEGFGVLGAAAMAFGAVEFDALGVFAALAAAVAAWVQAKQYQNLSTAYGITAQELAAVATELETLHDEADWPRFVGAAEEAISREHTLWRASRGIHVKPQRGIS